MHIDWKVWNKCLREVSVTEESWPSCCLGHRHVLKCSSAPSVVMNRVQREQQQVCQHPDDNAEQTAGSGPISSGKCAWAFDPSARWADAGEAAAAAQLDSRGRHVIAWLANHAWKIHSTQLGREHSHMGPQQLTHRSQEGARKATGLIRGIRPTSGWTWLFWGEGMAQEVCYIWKWPYI